jgi:predicted dinucleotide-utilizing enzyme
MSVVIAIVGLGTVGAEFLGEILKHESKGIDVRCVSELGETFGKNLARNEGIDIVSLDDMIRRAADIDVIFDLTGTKDVRRQLRQQLRNAGNTKTVVVSGTVTRLVWALMTDQKLPQPGDHDTGY